MDETCPNCGADWQRTELVAEASHGGGYRVRCHQCGHEWDDQRASHGERSDRRRAARRRVDLDRMLVDARTIWQGTPRLDLGGVVTHLSVVVGDLARHERDRHEGRPVDEHAVAVELGNVLLSVVRWCDDLGLDPGRCVEGAAQAQRRYRDNRWP